MRAPPYLRRDAQLIASTGAERNGISAHLRWGILPWKVFTQTGYQDPIAQLIGPARHPTINVARRYFCRMSLRSDADIRPCIPKADEPWAHLNDQAQRLSPPGLWGG
jgi:hypothetical protein